MEESNPLDPRLAALEQTVVALEARIAALESGSRLRTADPAPVWDTPALPGSLGVDVAGTVTLIGRTFVILAGAYLLRALTESGVVDRVTGVIAALVYAVAWILAADRTAPRQGLSATFFGTCTVLIGFPWLWEVTTRFNLLTPTTSAMALTGMTGLVLGVAWRRRLHALAWVATLSACLLASLLLVVTGGAIPFTSFLIVLGVATLWLGYDREWIWLRWVAGFFADLAVLALVGRALATPPRDPPSQVMLVQALLLAGYLGSILFRTIVRRRVVLPFEVAQTAAILVAGLAGALLITQRTGAGGVALGFVLLTFACACYTVTLVDSQQGRGANGHFYSALALVFALTGASLVFDNTTAATLYSTAAVLAAFAARHYRRGVLAAHALVYASAAMIGSGVVTAAVAALFGVRHDFVIGLSAWVVLLTLVGCWSLLARTDVDSAALPFRTVRLAFAEYTLLTVAGLSNVLAHRMLVSVVGGGINASVTATLRTGILAAVAVAVAWLGRAVATREFGKFLYPVLACGAAKLILEDIRISPPSVLFVAFALYGDALILGPRVVRPRT